MRRNEKFECEKDALRAMIAEGKKTHKQVASFLFSDSLPETADAKLYACLSPNKKESLSFKQVLAAMQFCENSLPLYYMCDETMHKRPERKAIEDEEHKLLQAINGAADVLQKAMAQLEQLQRVGK